MRNGTVLSRLRKLNLLVVGLFSLCIPGWAATVPAGSVISLSHAAGANVDSESNADLVASSDLPDSTLSNTRNKNTWVADGDVHVIVPNGATTYVGGQFNYIGPQTWGGAHRHQAKEDLRLSSPLPCFLGGLEAPPYRSP